MTRFALLVVAAAALAVLAASPAGAARFNGVVGPGQTITLKRNGVLVRSMAPGRHTFVIRDRSGIHNFVLSRGTTRLRATGIEFTGTKTWTVRIRRGAVYRYFCQTHTAEMTRTFRVS